MWVLLVLVWFLGVFVFLLFFVCLLFYVAGQSFWSSCLTMTTLAQLHDCHSCNDERSLVQKKRGQIQDFCAPAIQKNFPQILRLPLQVTTSPHCGIGTSQLPDVISIGRTETSNLPGLPTYGRTETSNSPDLPMAGPKHQICRVFLPMAGREHEIPCLWPGRDRNLCAPRRTSLPMAGPATRFGTYKVSEWREGVQLQRTWIQKTIYNSHSSPFSFPTNIVCQGLVQTGLDLHPMSGKRWSLGISSLKMFRLQCGFS